MEASVAEWSEAGRHVEGEELREGGQGPEHAGFPKREGIQSFI